MLYARMLLACSMSCWLGVSQARAQEVKVFSPVGSVTTCAHFLRADKDNFLAVLDYVLGFVSAAAIFSEENRMAEVNSTADVIAAIERYCSAYPDDTIINVARWLFVTKGGRD